MASVRSRGFSGSSWLPPLPYADAVVASIVADVRLCYVSAYSVFPRASYNVGWLMIRLASLGLALWGGDKEPGSVEA